MRSHHVALPRTALAGVGLALGGLAATARGRTHRVADRIAGLDPVAEAQEVMWLLASREFGHDVETALSLALFRTYASPSISVVLEATGEFTARPRKRYDDTELIMAEMSKHGFDHPRGRTALRRMNAMHAAYDIAATDTLYVLTTFILEPIRWIDRWGWRSLTDAERTAQVISYRELGRHMGLGDLPDDLAWYERVNRAYEAEHFAYHPANAAVADASMGMFLDMYLPAPLHRIGHAVVRALLDPPVLDAFGYDPAPPAVVAGVHGALRARAAVQRHLMPERRTDYDLTAVRRPTYPDGHVVAELGSFPDGATRTRANSAIADLRAACPVSAPRAATAPAAP
ncbi:DUF2236 domain-containing protein [Euzebya sp.]|uniref:DUF2236 domain-containing protein n=1 Tax=Euzebya sp. TaxID=1971409 RepID=UPI003516AA75